MIRLWRSVRDGLIGLSRGCLASDETRLPGGMISAFLGEPDIYYRIAADVKLPAAQQLPAAQPGNEIARLKAQVRQGALGRFVPQ